MSRTGITVHCRIRNEERFIDAAIRSVLPLADRVLVYDTASTDATIERVEAIKSPKITLVRLGRLSPLELAALRNEMADRTETDWYMQVDGDEIWPLASVWRLTQEIGRVPDGLHRLVVDRRHFYKSFNWISPVDRLGRIFRTSKIRTGIFSSGKVGHETPYLIDDPTRPWSEFSMRLPAEVFFYHCQYMQRSSQDAALGRLRGWRQPPFPVTPFFGPWPETLVTGPVVTRSSPAVVARTCSLNAQLLVKRCLRPQRMPGLWRLKAWPPKDITFPSKLASLPSANGAGKSSS